MPEPLHDVLESLVRSLIAYYRVKPIRVRVDIEEDPDCPLSWRVKEIAGSVVWQQTPPTPPPPTKPPPAKAPDLPISSPANDAVDAHADDDKGHFSQCISDIIDVIEKSTRPLTTTMVMNALSKAGKVNEKGELWGRRTVENYLRMMILDGTLENPEGAKPAGYRFPGQFETSDES